MLNNNMCQRIGGPKPCGCSGLGHAGYCDLASKEQREAYRKRSEEQIAAFILKLKEVSDALG